MYLRALSQMCVVTYVQALDAEVRPTWEVEMRLRALVTLLALILATSASAAWHVQTDRDEMTGERSCYAHSSTVPPTERMGFPYSDVQAWLGVGSDGMSDWAYIGFSTSPNLTGSKTKDGYDLITTRIKWDDKVEIVTLRQEWGSKFLHFLSDEKAMASMMAANTVLVELNWYGEGKVYFRFSLAGSTAAITKARLCQ